jgi:hypothetical protein
VRYVDEAGVAARLPPHEVFRLIQRYLAQREWSDAPAADTAAEPPVIKTGYRHGTPAAYRLRLDGEPPRYLTILAGTGTATGDGAGTGAFDGHGPAAVAATYLTYQRTAALLLAAPWLALAGRRADVLVVGGGRLGRAAAAMAAAVLEGARVRWLVRSPAAVAAAGVPDRVELTGRCAGPFDVLVTATGSTRPLAGEVPLRTARWLVVGGSVRTGAEIRGVPLAGRRQYADNPGNAHARGLLDAPRELPAGPTAGSAVGSSLADEPSVVVVCGGGGVDGFLAAELLRTHPGKL